MRNFYAFSAVAIAFGIVYSTYAPAPVIPGLPSDAEAKQLLDSTHRHREWVNLPIGSSGMRVFTVYPERADRAPVAVLTATTESASHWLRATAVRLADRGYIAVVPDILSGMAPQGGDGDSFSDSAAAAAMRRMDAHEIERRVDAARRYAVALPSADGQSATMQFDQNRKQVAAAVFARNAESRKSWASHGWSESLAFLDNQTANHPIAGKNDLVPEDHSMHVGMAMAQAPPQPPAGGAGPVGYPRGKLAELPAGTFNATSALRNSKLRREFIDIPMGSTKLHTWVEYPEGTAKAPIVMVMQHGPGMDDWQRALADQLAQDGFIAIAVDLHSGLGANGGAFDSFQGTDEVMRASARLTQDDMQARYKAGLDWGKKLPRWNGKAASIGFCMGGGNSFRFAGEVPELNAAVSFYGATPNDAILSKVKAPVLAFYGEDDARVTSAADPTKAAMQKLGKSFEHYVYPHATHGFLEFQDLAGNPTATSDSWAKTIQFLRKHTM